MTTTHTVALWILIVLASGCSRKTSIANRTAPLRTKSDMLSALVAHNVDFDWWSGEGKISISSPEESGSGKTYLRMRKDSLVWMVGKKMSLEGVRLHMTPEEVVIKYPIEKVYQRAHLDHLLGTYDVDLSFADMQHLLAGNVMLPDSSTMSHELDKKTGTIEYGDGNYTYRYTIDSKTSHLLSLDIQDTDNRSIQVRYSNYKFNETAGKWLSYERQIMIADRAEIDLRFSEIEVNVAKNTPFSISARYREISL